MGLLEIVLINVFAVMFDKLIHEEYALSIEYCVFESCIELVLYAVSVCVRSSSLGWGRDKAKWRR